MKMIMKVKKNTVEKYALDLLRTLEERQKERKIERKGGREGEIPTTRYSKNIQERWNGGSWAPSATPASRITNRAGRYRHRHCLNGPPPPIFPPFQIPKRCSGIASKRPLNMYRQI